jgi:hypothetical protein
MRRKVVFISVLLGVLLYTLPSFALSYSGSATLDWSALTFSGISSTFHFDPNDINGPAIAQGAAAIISPQPDLQEWTTTAISSVSPDVGTALAVASPTVLSASASLIGVGGFGAGIGRFGSLLAHESGALTISIPYVLTQAVSPNSWVAPPTFTTPNVSPYGFTGVRLNFGLGSSIVELDARTGTGSQAGTLTRTFTMSAGEQTILSLTAGTAAFVTSVPVPDMLWPTLAGMFGIVLYAESVRRKSLMP